MILERYRDNQFFSDLDYCVRLLFSAVARLLAPHLLEELVAEGLPSVACRPQHLARFTGI
jgi:hypothetical protein